MHPQGSLQMCFLASTHIKIVSVRLLEKPACWFYLLNILEFQVRFSLKKIFLKYENH